MDKLPLREGQEARVALVGTGGQDLLASCVLEVVEVGGGGTGNDTVEVVGEFLSRLQALATTSGAAEVVRVAVVVGVVAVDNLLTGDGGLVAGTVRPVEDGIPVVLECPAVEGRAVVAAVVTSNSETLAENVGHIDVVNAAVNTTVVRVHDAAVPVRGVGKEDLHVGSGLVGGGNGHGDTANVNRRSEGGSTANLGLHRSGVGLDVGIDASASPGPDVGAGELQLRAELGAVAVGDCGGRRSGAGGGAGNNAAEDRAGDIAGGGTGGSAGNNAAEDRAGDIASGNVVVLFNAGSNIVRVADGDSGGGGGRDEGQRLGGGNDSAIGHSGSLGLKLSADDGGRRVESVAGILGRNLNGRLGRGRDLRCSACLGGQKGRLLVGRADVDGRVDGLGDDDTRGVEALGCGRA